MTRTKSILCTATIFCLLATTQALAGDPDPGSEPTPKPTAAPCSMDMDPNGGFDFGDYLWVLANWGPCTDAFGENPQPDDRCHGDIDQDGQIGFAEILFVLNHFGQNCV